MLGPVGFARRLPMLEVLTIAVIGTIRREFLDHVLILNEAHARESPGHPRAP